MKSCGDLEHGCSGPGCDWFSCLPDSVRRLETLVVTPHVVVVLLGNDDDDDDDDDDDF